MFCYLGHIYEMNNLLLFARTSFGPFIKLASNYCYLIQKTNTDELHKRMQLKGNFTECWRCRNVPIYRAKGYHLASSYMRYYWPVDESTQFRCHLTVYLPSNRLYRVRKYPTISLVYCFLEPTTSRPLSQL